MAFVKYGKPALNGPPGENSAAYWTYGVPICIHPRNPPDMAALFSV